MEQKSHSSDLFLVPLFSEALLSVQELEQASLLALSLLSSQEQELQQERPSVQVLEWEQVSELGLVQELETLLALPSSVQLSAEV